MPNMDVFQQDPFQLFQMTARVNKMPFVPGRVGQLGIFREVPVTTLSVGIEELAGTLRLVPAQNRGAPPIQSSPDKRVVRQIRTIHLPEEDTILAGEIQGVRAFGTNNEVQQVQAVVDGRQEKLLINQDATIEHLRVGAVKGQILDADGSTVLYDLYNEFEVTKDPDVAFPFGGVIEIRNLASGIKRDMAAELGNVPFTGVHAFCGDSFFDTLKVHPETKAAFDRWQDGAHLRDDFVFDMFPYAGIMWENYRGAVNGQPFIGTDDVHFLPTGAPGLFEQYNAPADFMETVNTPGLPRYSKVAPDPDGMNRSVKVHVQSNPLPLCLRPKVLRKGTAT